jgi:release factor glutamine methyltransferase
VQTILEILNLSANYLTRKGIIEPRLQAEELISQALDLKRMDIYVQFDRPLVDEELAKCRSWLQRRGQGEPLQYIHGQVEFFNCVIKVTPAVLIPRQETEILVDKIIKVLAQEVSLSGKVLLDLCCGSGYIGIALKKQFPELTVYLSDISAKALEIARENANNNGVDVEFLEGDLLLPFKDRSADFIVCNPPYISEKEFPALDVEVRAYEPRQALVGGESGLEFYERLAGELPLHLNSGSKVWFEIGSNQGEAVNKLFKAAIWKKCCVDKDWSGHDRFFSLEIE